MPEAKPWPPEFAPPLIDKRPSPVVVETADLFAGDEIELTAEEMEAVVWNRRRHVQIQVLPVAGGNGWRVKVATYFIEGQWPGKEQALEIAKLFAGLVQPAEIYEHDAQGVVVDKTSIPAPARTE